MNEEFNKEFLKLSEKDQKAILNLIQLKNMNKKTEYKKRIEKAIEVLKLCNSQCSKEVIEILKGEDNE